MVSGILAGAVMAGVLSHIPFLRDDSRPLPKPHPVIAPASRPLAEAPYEIRDGVVLITARINRAKSFKAAIATGLPVSGVVTRTAFEAGVPLWTDREAPPLLPGESGARRMSALAIRVQRVNLFSAKPHAAYGRPDGVPRAADAWIGADALGGYVVRIDPSRRVVDVYDFVGFKPTTAAVALPLTVTERGLSLPATFILKDGTRVERQARLDTGLMDMAGAAPDLADRIGWVQVGPWAVGPAAAADRAVPAVGNGLLDRFVVTIDVAHRKLYLEPYGDPRTPPDNRPYRKFFRPFG